MKDIPNIQDAIIDEYYDTCEAPSTPSNQELLDCIREIREEVRNLREEIKVMKVDIATLDSNTNEMDDDVTDIHRTINTHSCSIKGLVDDITVMKDEMCTVRTDMMSICKPCKCDAIQNSLSIENTIAHNRIWRMYSNNFHQNLLFKNSNFLTQSFLLQSSPHTKK
jgi:uncharacterized protein YoxC